MLRVLKNYLSKRDLCELLTISYNTINCSDTDSLKVLLLGINQFFPCESIVCVRGNVQLALSQDEPKIDTLDVSYPTGYLDYYFRHRFHKSDSVVRQFIETIKPVNWGKVKSDLGQKYVNSVCAVDFGMKDGWTHGTLNKDTMNCSIFFFGSPFTEVNRRTETILEYLTPFLSEAYKKILNEQKLLGHDLTPREIEVLRWVKEGKSSWEISVILKCSKRVVDFHVSNAKRKLNAVTRPQAIANVIQKKIIEF